MTASECLMESLKKNERNERKMTRKRTLYSTRKKLDRSDFITREDFWNKENEKNANRRHTEENVTRDYDEKKNHHHQNPIRIPPRHQQHDHREAYESTTTQPPLIDFKDMMRVFYWLCKKTAREKTHDLHLPPIHHYARQNLRNLIKKSGDQIWKEIQEEIRVVFPECWNVQWELVQAMLRINIRRIYMQELELCLNRLMSQNGLQTVDLVNILLILAPRRFGKTTAQASVVAVLLICVPGFIHLHFPILVNSGLDFISQILGFIESSPRGSAMIKGRQKKDRIILHGDAYVNDIRKSSFLAANIKVSLLLTSVFLDVCVFLSCDNCMKMGKGKKKRKSR